MRGEKSVPSFRFEHDVPENIVEASVLRRGGGRKKRKRRAMRKVRQPEEEREERGKEEEWQVHHGIIQQGVSGGGRTNPIRGTTVSSKM